MDIMTQYSNVRPENFICSLNDISFKVSGDHFLVIQTSDSVLYMERYQSWNS